MRKQMRLGNRHPDQIQAQRESAKGEPRSLSLQFFFLSPPFTRGVGVKNLDAVSFLNGAAAPGR